MLGIFIPAKLRDLKFVRKPRKGGGVWSEFQESRAEIAPCQAICTRFIIDLPSYAKREKHQTWNSTD